MSGVKTSLKLMFALSILLLFFPVKAYGVPEISRLAGSDRYSTAVEISKAGWGRGTSEYAIIATGEDYPDALCAAPLAKKYNAPILLTSGARLDKKVEDELFRLGVKNVYIIGGVSLIPVEVEEQIKSKGIKCTRIAGSDRYETPIKIAEHLGNFDEIVIAADSDFPDVLSIAPVAAKKGMPIILSPKDELPGYVADYLKNKGITKTHIIGGPELIDKSVVQQLQDLNPRRIYGQDRYETNTLILDEFASVLNFSTIYIATGTNFPDALSGTPAAALTSSPVILLDKTPSAVTKSFLSNRFNSIYNLKVLGGEGVVSEAALKDLVNIAAGDRYNDYSLRYSAEFRVKVYENVYWVPANTLGKPRFAKGQILGFGRDTEGIRSSINTLYDAVQYIRAIDFKGYDDNIFLEEGGYNWQHHKPGVKALYSNEGSYASISNLANYLLKGNYEDTGFIHYFQKDGTEYVLNYIKYNNKYYMVDLTRYRNDFRYTSIESGDLKNYYDSDYILGNVHEASSMGAYMKYCIDKFSDPPELCIMYSSDNVLPVAVKQVDVNTHVCLPKDFKASVTVLHDVQDDNLSLSFIDGPMRFPSWL